MDVDTTDDRIVIRLTLPAGAGTVWQALVDPKHVGSWWGAHLQMDVRPGGRVVGRWNDGSRKVTTTGRFTHLEPPQTLQLAWAEDDWPAETQVEFSLAGGDGAGRTELVLVHSGWESLPRARRADLMRHQAADWSHCMRNLADYVAELAA